MPTVISSGSSLPTPSTCLTGEFLSWNGSAFMCGVPSGSGSSTPLNLFASNGLTLATTSTSTTVGLGGILSKNTTLDLDTQELNLVRTNGLLTNDTFTFRDGLTSLGTASLTSNSRSTIDFDPDYAFATGLRSGENQGILIDSTLIDTPLFLGVSKTGASIGLRHDTGITFSFSNGVIPVPGNNVGYTFPRTSGGVGQVMINDGLGSLSWGVPAASSTNGLSVYPAGIGLGGTLSQNTVIDTNNSEFRMIGTTTDASRTIQNRFVKNITVPLTVGFSLPIDLIGTYSANPTNTKISRAGMTSYGGGSEPFFDSYAFEDLGGGSSRVGRLYNSDYGPGMYYQKYNGPANMANTVTERSYAQTRNNGGFYAVGSRPVDSMRSDLNLNPTGDLLIRSFNQGSTQATYSSDFRIGSSIQHTSPGFVTSISIATSTGVRISDLGSIYSFPRAGVASGTIMGFDDASGQLKFLTPNQIGLIASTTNGLSLATAGAVQLGGTLNATTTIVQGANSLIFERPIFSLANRGLTTWTTASGIPLTTNDFSGVTASTSDVSFVAGANSRLGRPAFEINTARFVGGNANESFLFAFDTAFQAGLSQRVAGVNTNTSSYRSDSNGSHIRSHSISNTRYSNLKLRPNGLNEWFLASTTASTISNSSTGISFNLATGVTFYGGLGAGSQYTFPNMDGVSSTILTTNGAGQLAFNSIPSLIANAGNISIGTSSLLARLHVFEPSTNPVARFENTDGYCEIDPTNTALVCTSDASLKKDVETLPTTLSLFTQLHPVTYRWNAQSTSTTPQYGFIAQEVEALYPTLVFTNSQTNIKTLAYTALIPLTVQAVKELNQSLGDLTNPKVTEETFAGSTIFKKILATFEWLGIKISNGLAEFKTVKTEKLCVGNTCLTEVQVQKILEQIEEQSVQIPSALEVPPVASSTEVAEDPVLAETGSPEPIIEAENITTGPDSEDNTPQI